MKRRIFLYNTVAVLLALAALLLISSEVVRRVGAHYAGQAQPEDPPSTAAARELMETWEGSWTELSQRLEGLGYQLQVSLDGTAVFSTLSDVQQDLLLQQGGAGEWPEGEAAELWNGQALVLGIQSGEYTLVAMSRPNVPEVFGRQRPQSEASVIPAHHRHGGHPAHRRAERGLHPLSDQAHHAPGERPGRRRPPGGGRGPVHPGGLSGQGRVRARVHRL